MQWLRGPNRNVELELETIRSNIGTKNLRTNPFPELATGNLLTKASVQTVCTNIKSVLKNVRIIKPVSITCGLMFFQRFTGKRKKLCQNQNQLISQCNRMICQFVVFVFVLSLIQGLTHLVSIL